MKFALSKQINCIEQFHLPYVLQWISISTDWKRKLVYLLVFLGICFSVLFMQSSSSAKQLLTSSINETGVQCEQRHFDRNPGHSISM